MFGPALDRSVVPHLTTKLTTGTENNLRPTEFYHSNLNILFANYLRDITCWEYAHVCIVKWGEGAHQFDTVRYCLGDIAYMYII